MMEQEEKLKKKNLVNLDPQFKPNDTTSNFAKMTSKNEKELVAARKNFYSEAKVNERYLKIGEFTGKRKKFFLSNENIHLFQPKKESQLS